MNSLLKLITNYTQKIIDNNDLERAQTATTALYRTKRGNEKLINSLIKHEQELEVIVNGIDELEEENKYKKEHREFTSKISAFYHDYKAVKFEIFSLIKDLMKTDKMKNLIK